MKNLEGIIWGELTSKEQNEVLLKSNCVDGRTGNDAKNGKCIVDFGEYSIAGEIIDNEIVIADEAEFYNPSAPSWGGKREGAGRPTTGRKKKTYYITDEEDKKLREYLEELRKE